MLDRDVELGVVVAFGKLIRPHVLDAVPMVNLHFSLLPRWRGAAPVERAVLAGDDETGVCLMALDPGLDTGRVHGCVRVTIDADETTDDLRRRLVDVGTPLLVDRCRQPSRPPSPQSGEPTYAAKLDAGRSPARLVGTGRGVPRGPGRARRGPRSATSGRSSTRCGGRRLSSEAALPRFHRRARRWCVATDTGSNSSR